MLAKETDKPFDDKEWLFEIKWDGYRAIAEKNGDQISLYSRNGLDFTQTYPIVLEQLKAVQHDVIVDGEIVVLDDEGQPNFQLLQHYSENHHRPIQFQLFDLLSMDGEDTTGLTLIERKQLLEQLIPENDVIRYSGHIIGDGKQFFKVTEEKNLEGMMAKKSDSKYYAGERTANWLKVKHNKTREAIIAGFTAPAGSRQYFGALILAVKDGAQFKYIGHTGTGFNNSLLKEMYDLLQPLVQKESPFHEKIKTNSSVTWVKPEVVCEIKFTEVTNDGKLRHPVFIGLRIDKDKNEVTMSSDKKVKVPAKEKKKEEKTESKKKQKSLVPKQRKDGVFTFGKNKVTVSHPDKIYFPEDNVTKLDVVNYYVSMADYILPYLKGRPEALLRNPNGIHAKGFFHKDAAENVPSFVKSEVVHSESNDKEIDYIVCDNLATLVYMNNLGCIEINPWHSTVKALDKPDYLMIDIDPSEKNSFDEVVEAALMVKEILDKAGAVSFCKTSGATGLHVFVPTGKKYTYEQVKDFAYIVCMLAQEQLTDFTTLERNLKKRGNKHIYMDYLQNRRGQTIASAYSLRPKVGATVSTPLLWEEVKKGLSPSQFTIHNIEDRVKKMGDLFGGVLGKGIDLKKCLTNLNQ